ncbi:MAG: glycosyltransferase family 4 protein, partial [Chloroflexi bacterium]
MGPGPAPNRSSCHRGRHDRDGRPGPAAGAEGRTSRRRHRLHRWFGRAIRGDCRLHGVGDLRRRPTPAWPGTRAGGARMNNPPRVLLLDENAPVPADRRVWYEALTLRDAGFKVSVVSPKWHYARRHEQLEGIDVYRFPLPSLGGIGGHLVEYAIATPILFAYSWFVYFRQGFDVIHAANPPDFLYLIARVFK